jgi:transposase
MDVVIKKQISKIYTNFKKKETRGRKQFFPIYDYLDAIFYVLKSGISWRLYCSINNSPYSHTSLYRFYIKLCDLDIFNLVYNRLLKKYRLKRLRSLRLNEYERLFLDSTMIKNINGRDCIGHNHYDRNRNGTKLNVIIDDNSIPIGHVLVGANTNDSTLITPTIEKIQSLHRNSYVIADKGYINEKIRIKYKSKHIHLIYPKRKNQHMDKINPRHVLLMSKRIKVEHFFAQVKSYKRIRNRFDCKYKSFLNFIILCFLDIIKNIF